MADVDIVKLLVQGGAGVLVIATVICFLRFLKEEREDRRIERDKAYENLSQRAAERESDRADFLRTLGEDRERFLATMNNYSKLIETMTRLCKTERKKVNSRHKGDQDYV
jgi:hypothetical protein